jgi:hypothetical protein
MSTEKIWTWWGTSVIPIMAESLKQDDLDPGWPVRGSQTLSPKQKRTWACSSGTVPISQMCSPEFKLQYSKTKKVQTNMV